MKLTTQIPMPADLREKLYELLNKCLSKAKSQTCAMGLRKIKDILSEIRGHFPNIPKFGGLIFAI